MSDTVRHIIAMAPLGEFAPALLDDLDTQIAAHFGCTTRRLALTGDLGFAFDALRRQYHSTAILDHLARLAPPQALKVLGIVQVDLFIPILTHVYGEAQLDGRAAVVSAYRLGECRSDRPVASVARERLVKETLHELGHTFNLRHCPEPSCLMHYCRSEEDVDRKEIQFCRYCRIMLADARRRTEDRGRTSDDG